MSYCSHGSGMLLKKLHVDRKKQRIPGSFFFFFSVSFRKGKKKKETKEKSEMDHKMFKGNQIQDDQNNSEFVDKLEEILGTSVFRGKSYARDLAW